MKKLFGTPGRAVVSTLCIVAVVLALLIGVGAAAFSRGIAAGRATYRNDPAPGAPAAEPEIPAPGAPAAEPEIPATQKPTAEVASPAAAAPTAKPVSGTVSGAQTAATEQITLEAGKAAALADAGLSEEDVTFTKMKLDYDHGRAYYDIEFFTADTEYDYEIDAYTGAVGEKSVETRSGQSPVSPGANGTAGEYIGADEAEEIALTHAGVDRTDAWFVKSQLDRDDGRMEYEVEFFSDGVEYDYTIDAVTGEVLEYDTDYD